MPRLLSLAHLSVLECTPPQVVACAAAAGFDAVGLRLSPARPSEACHPIIGNAAMRRETLSRLADGGVAVLDVEVIWLQSDMDLSAHDSMFETAACLGARRVIATCADPDEGRVADHVALLCDRASPFGLSIDLEFIRWTELRSLAAALRVIGLASRDNLGVLVDCLHAARAGVTATEISSVDRSRIGYFQLCDAPRDPPLDGDFAHEARFDRLPPGGGGLPLRAMVAALPPGVPCSVETPMAGELGAMAPLERARLLFDATRRVLGT